MKSFGPSAVAIIVGLVLQGTAAIAQEPAARITVSSPQQPLRDALNSLARQTGLQIIYTAADVTAGITAPPLQGQFTPQEALNALLRGSGLSFEFLNSTAVAITPANAANTGSTQTGGTQQLSTDTIETVNVFGTLENELSVGSKSGLSLRETPKSVTLVTRERIEAQNLTSLHDVLNQTTGVTLGRYSAVESFYMARGYRVTTVQLDGGAPAISTGFGTFMQPDTAMYDHIEMLRGVDGMYTGAGEPGGVINLVRKRAKRTPELQFSLSGGSWNDFGGELDVTGPLAQDGRLRGRVVGAYKNNDYFYDRAQSEKTIFFGTVDYDLTPSTLLVAGASYERRKEDGYFVGGLPRYADGRDLGLPRSTAINPDWNHWYFTTREVFARVEQNFGNTGVIKLNLTRLEQESQNRLVSMFGPVDPVTLTGPTLQGRAFDFTSVQDLVDLSVSGTFQLFGHEHRYTVGADYAKADGGGQRGYSLDGYTYPDYPAVDVFNFDPALYPRPAAILSSYWPAEEQAQNGFYATVGLQLIDSLRLTLGGRYGEFRYLSTYQSVDVDGTFGESATTRYRDKKFIPSAALSWDFAPDWSAYVSYAETFKVQASQLRAPLPGTPLDPITGGGFELGVKAEVLELLNASIGVYRIEREGQSVRDPRYPPTPGTAGSSCCFLPLTNITSEGVDLEVSGTVLPGWQLFAGYTYNESKHEGNTGFLYEAYFLNLTPEHMFKMWTTWQLPGQYSRWTVNAGVVAQSASHVSGFALAAPGSEDFVAYEFTQDPYSVWNASLQYRLSDTLTIGLYGENLFDEKYYASIGDTYADNTYATPRSYVLTLRGRW